MTNAKDEWVELRHPYHLDEKREQMNYAVTVEAASIE